MLRFACLLPTGDAGEDRTTAETAKVAHVFCAHQQTLSDQRSPQGDALPAQHETRPASGSVETHPDQGRAKGFALDVFSPPLRTDSVKRFLKPSIITHQI